MPTAPTVTGGGTATAWQNVASVTVDAAGSTDAGGSGFAEYQVRWSSNGGLTYGAVSDASTLPVSNEGNNWVQFHSVDNAGNVSAWVTAYARIDRTVPTAPNVVGGGSLWKAGTSVSVSATGSSDAGSGIANYEYQTSTDATTWSAATAGSRATITTPGHSYVRFRAVDKAGFVSAWSQTDVWFDGGDPTLPTVSGGSNSWTNASSVTVSAAGATDAVSGIFNYQYRKSTDGGNTWSLPVNGSSVNITAVGETVVQFRSTDNAGRHSAYAPATPTAGSTVRIDRIAPSDPSVTNDSQTWKDVASVAVAASGSTDTGGAAMNHYERQTSTDGGATWSALTSGSSISVTAEGETLVRFQAVDGAGNRSALVQATVRIDRSDPTPATVSGGSLSWTVPGTYPITGSGSTDSPGSGVTGYQYRTSTDGGSSWSTGDRRLVGQHVGRGRDARPVPREGHPGTRLVLGPVLAGRRQHGADRRHPADRSDRERLQRQLAHHVAVDGVGELDRSERLGRRRVRVPDVAGQQHVVERDRRQLGGHLDPGHDLRPVPRDRQQRQRQRLVVLGHGQAGLGGTVGAEPDRRQRLVVHHEPAVGDGERFDRRDVGWRDVSLPDLAGQHHVVGCDHG